MGDQWDQLEGVTPQVREDLRRIERAFGQVSVEPVPEDVRMNWQEELDDVVLTEPILAKKDCRLEITAAESATWTVKPPEKGGAPGHGAWVDEQGARVWKGEEYQAMKLTLLITDQEVQTEHEGSRPRLTLEHQCNIAKYPYLDKKSGTVKWLGRANLHELEEAFGFEPVFQDAQGNGVAPYVTRTGRKVAPKGEGITRKLNPDFLSAYFTPAGHPNLEWGGKTVWADIGVESSEQFGDRNKVQRFKRAPVSV